MMSLIRPSPERDPQDERSIISRLLVVKDKAVTRKFLLNKKDKTMDFCFVRLSPISGRYIYIYIYIYLLFLIDLEVYDLTGR